MINRTSESRMLWLVVGLLAGLCISYFWPHEPVVASATDRNEKFAMATCYVTNTLEAVFVLDFLTGRLTGSVLNRQGNVLVARYTRNVAEDFDVNPEVKPTYTMVCGRAQIQGRGGNQYGDSMIYIGELSSGQVIAYAIPYKQFNRKQTQPIPLQKAVNFQFREALQIE